MLSFDLLIIIEFFKILLTFLCIYYNLIVENRKEKKQMIQEFYEKINGNYEVALSRMQNDERIKKYLNFFLMDESYKVLEEGINSNDCEAAFRGAHTLKGVCQNMAFTALSTATEQITEELRAKDIEKAKLTFKKVEEEYKKVIDEIHKIM